MSFVEDTLRQLESKEEYEMNQYFAGINDLFRAFTVKVGEEASFSKEKCKVLNKIVVRK